MKPYTIIIILSLAVFTGCGPTEREQDQQDQRQMELQEQHQESDVPYNFRLQMETLLDHYFELSDAMVDADPESAAENAQELSAWTYDVIDEVLNTEDQGLWLGIARILRSETENLAAEDSVNEQKVYFSRISRAVIRIADSFQPVNGSFYHMECDQISEYSADWLSREEESTNPYEPQSMGDCAEIVERL